MKASIVLLAVLASASFTARAGWYQVNDYEGKIGPYPIHLSLQKYAFGSDLNLMGSYYYDTHRTPIPLYGKYIGSGTIEACEIHSPAEYDKYLVTGSKAGFDTGACPFKLTVDGVDLRGTWHAGEKTYEVALKHTATLDDTVPGATKGAVEIPFWGQTATHSFLGIYQGSDAGVSIDKIKVINKATGKVDQTLDPRQHDCAFGFFMTPIYMNVESGPKGTRIDLNCESPKGGDTVEYRYEGSKGSYLFSDDEGSR